MKFFLWFFYSKPQYVLFFPGARVQNAMNCNAPIKTMNCNCQKNKEWLYDTKANYTCFKMIFSWKDFVMQCHNRSKVSCTVKPNIQYNIVSLRLPHFLHSLHFWWALFRAVAGISPFSTLKQFIFIPRNTFYFTWLCTTIKRSAAEN